MLAWAAVVLGLTVRLAAVHVRMAGRCARCRPLDPATLPIELGPGSRDSAGSGARFPWSSRRWSPRRRCGGSCGRESCFHRA